jgi:hypothetical protein
LIPAFEIVLGVICFDDPCSALLSLIRAGPKTRTSGIAECDLSERIAEEAFLAACNLAELLQSEQRPAHRKA